MQRRRSRREFRASDAVRILGLHITIAFALQRERRTPAAKAGWIFGLYGTAALRLLRVKSRALTVR